MRIKCTRSALYTILPYRTRGESNAVEQQPHALKVLVLLCGGLDGLLLGCLCTLFPRCTIFPKCPSPCATRSRVVHLKIRGVHCINLVFTTIISFPQSTSVIYSFAECTIFICMHILYVCVCVLFSRTLSQNTKNVYVWGKCKYAGSPISQNASKKNVLSTVIRAHSSQTNCMDARGFAEVR